MSLYPSLEDMKVSQMMTAQTNAYSNAAPQNTPAYSPPSAYPSLNGATTGPYPVTVSAATAPPAYTPSSNGLYPSLGEYMGMELTPDLIARNTPNDALAHLQAPISGTTVGLRSQVTNGVRELTLCKDAHGKIGLRVRAIDNGVFVCLVQANTPAAMAGLRFGDQILQIDDENVAGYSMDKVHGIFRGCAANGIKVVVRDRPFERSLTLHKDSANQLGFRFKNGKITDIVKDSSAARNGLLTEHQLLEVNGQNVIGMKDKDVIKIVNDSASVVTITVIPNFMFDHMIKKMNVSLIKESMNHAAPMF